MRTAATIVFACSAIAAPCAAYPVEWSIGDFLSGVGVEDPPRTGALQIFDFSAPSPRPILAVWNVPGVFPADEGRIWTLTATNAATLGVDWGVFEAVADDPARYALASRFHTEPPPPWAVEHVGNSARTLGCCSGRGEVRFLRLDRIDFYVEQFDQAGPAAQWLVRHTWFGDGYYIPEPSTAWMCVTALGIPLRTRRSSRRS